MNEIECVNGIETNKNIYVIHLNERDFANYEYYLFFFVLVYFSKQSVTLFFLYLY